MPIKHEYVNPDGSIWYFNDWTEEMNKNFQEWDEEFANSEEWKKFLEDRKRRLEESLTKSREERQNKNKK